MPSERRRRDDFLIVDRREERRDELRIIASVPGYYSLADHRNLVGDRRVYACRAINLSAHALALAAPVSGRLGERVFATIEHLGKLKGAVLRVLERGFVMSITASEEERSNLTRKIEWLDRYKNFDTSDRRGDMRFVPTNPYTRLELSDGSTETCLVLDLSSSGAAISAETVPEIGDVIAVGTLMSRVVRHFVGGFAVKFIDPVSDQYVEAMAICD
jgi:hypothetical protein